MTKQELALEVIERLKKEYPDADCTLDYDNAWKLLVSVRLAAQCTDARVNVVVQDLYAKFPTVEALENDADQSAESLSQSRFGYTASSQRFRFHWVPGGDSVAMVTPFGACDFIVDSSHNNVHDCVEQIKAKLKEFSWKL